MSLFQQGQVEASATVLINSLAQEKIAAGFPIHNLSVGEPLLPMHPQLIQAATHAMQNGKIYYPPVAGVTQLRQLACEWMNRRYQCDYAIKNSLVVNGGKLGIYLTLQYLLKADDEVIIAAPYWVSYPALVKLFKGKPIILETDKQQQWKLSPQQLKSACTNKTRMLILNNAANPTGVIYSKAELEALLAIAKEQQLIVLSDEVYSELTYDHHTFVSCGAFSEYRDRVIVIQSCSKNFAMTGWRVGFVFADEVLIQALTALVGQSTSGVTTVSQHVGIAAFEMADELSAWVRQEMLQRRDAMLDSFKQHFNVQPSPPPSALYFFMAIRDLGVSELSSLAFCRSLIEHAGVACVPGLAFGCEEYVRMSFGLGVEEIRKAVKQLGKFLAG